MTVSPAESALVLVVDDTASVRAHVSALVTNLGHRAIAVGSCDEALAALEKELPALVLMDLQMEPTRGDACCKLIRADPRYDAFPIAMLTSADQPNDLMYCWRAQADDFLPKPASGEQLEAKLVAVMKAHTEAPQPAAPMTLLVAVTSPFMKAEVGQLLEHVGLAAAYARSLAQLSAMLAEPSPLRCGYLVDVAMADGLAALEACRAAAQKTGLPVTAIASGEVTPEVAKRTAQLTGRPLVVRDAAAPAVVADEVLQTQVPLERAALNPVERLPFFSIIEFRVGDGPFFTGYSFSLAADSLFLRTLNVLPPGTEVEMRVHFADAKDTMKCTGVVAWANSFRDRRAQPVPLGMGVKFLDVDPLLRRLAPRGRGASPSSPGQAPAS